MQSVTINPSIATIVDIGAFGFGEPINIYFTATGNWTGTFEFTMWNSDKKNRKFKTIEVPTTTNLMILSLDFSSENFPPDIYYYEVKHIEDKRVLFKGKLNLIN